MGKGSYALHVSINVNTVYFERFISKQDVLSNNALLLLGVLNFNPIRLLVTFIVTLQDESIQLRNAEYDIFTIQTPAGFREYRY
jgi:hypothetical protein